MLSLLWGIGRLSADVSPDRQSIDRWFVQEVLPLEPAFVRFLRRNWRDKSEVGDLRQESYLKIYEAARQKLPLPVKPFLFSIARNLMIDRLRQKNVVSIETMADIEWTAISDTCPTPERYTAARQELRRMQAVLDDLPPRCRQILVLRRVHGFSQREVARKLGISEETVQKHVIKGMRILADATLDRRASLIAGARRLLARKG